MDAEGSLSEDRSSCPQVRGHGRATRDNIPRNPGEQNDSKRCRLAGAMSRDGLVCEGIELSGTRAALYLAIPDFRVELAEPLTKGGKLFVGE